MSLHPEVEKEIEAGPLASVEGRFGAESLEEFARRCVEFAVEKERDGCAKVCEEMIAFDLDDPGKSAAAAIRRRGKP